jgi:CRISPR-associated endonuclease/helicase Cas3
VDKVPKRVPLCPVKGVGMAADAKFDVSLSVQARSLWGKSDYGVGESWLPLYVHMADSAGVASRLWDSWVPRSTKGIIARAFDGDETLAQSLFVLLAAVHDIGKATPAFQVKGLSFRQGGEGGILWKPEHAGLVIRHDLSGRPCPTHPIAGEVLLTKYLKEHCFTGDVQGRQARRRTKKQASAISCIVGAHHGRFPSTTRLVPAGEDGIALGWGGEGSADWVRVQDELISYALRLADLSESDMPRLANHRLTIATESILTGLVIMTDWIASDQDIFPLVSLFGEDEGVRIDFETRCARAWDAASILPAWSESRPDVLPFDQFFAERFALPKGAKPRPIQVAAARVAWELDEPGIMVIEAPMGEGKTEAALSAGELLAWRYGLSGVCVALPTMATTDAMFDRVESWLERLPHDGSGPDKDIYLAHGKAQLNEHFQGLIRRSRQTSRFEVGVDMVDENGRSRADDVLVSDWMFGRKRGMLSNFVVCTVDQVLMGALNMKHLSLRQLALANKVVVIDECHAYDLYMRQYLNVLLQWLGYWRVQVILLSATLPTSQRNEMIGKYLEGRRLSVTSAEEAQPESENDDPALSSKDGDAYPLITYSNGDAARSIETKPSGRVVSVSVSLIDDSVETLAELLADRLAGGGCAGVICDTVGRAQEVERTLAARFGDKVVMLDHSRFMDIDRMENERVLRDLLGSQATTVNGKRPGLLIVAGTQVLEQSLDIDFDLLVTDIAPVDLVLQRLGRTHRHHRGKGECDRPASLRTATCYVRGVASFGGNGPEFAQGLTRVYDKATLTESLAVLGLDTMDSGTSIALPHDIPRLVRTAYSDDVRNVIPDSWSEEYASQRTKRDEKFDSKVHRAQTCLLAELPHAIQNEWSLVNLSDQTRAIADDSRDEDRGQRAVRDTQETVEVLLVRKRPDGGISLPPWVGDKKVEKGGELPTDFEPSREQSLLLAQCAVRLPLSVCPLPQIDACIEELERRSGMYVRCWQESPWLAGRLLLPMDEAEPGVFKTKLLDKQLRYTRREGFSTVGGTTSLPYTNSDII